VQRHRKLSGVDFAYQTQQNMIKRGSKVMRDNVRRDLLIIRESTHIHAQKQI
jgi:hypothetical protein